MKKIKPFVADTLLNSSFFTKQWLWVFFYGAPILAVWGFVRNFGVDVPVFDSLALVDLLYKINLGDASFSDFWTLHNEHRFFIPKFAIATLAFVTKWNTKFQQYFNVVLALVFVAVLYWISWQKNNGKSPHFANILGATAMTSLVQYENWLWGFQMAWFWINLCLIVALALLSHEKGERSLDRHFVLAALFCLLASLSAAHGLLLWLAVLPSLWVRSWKSRKPLLPIVFWFGCFLGTTILYFFDYQKPRHNVDNSYILKAPMDGIKFFFAVLGRPLSSEPSNAIVWGILLSIASLVTISLFLRQRTHRESLAPWLSLMLFPLGFAAITTVGRASLGLPAALASRYTTVSLLLIVGLVYVAQHYVKTSGWKIRFGYRAVAAGIAVILITTSLSFWERGTVFRNERLLGKTCLSLVEYLEDSQSSCVQKVFPHVAVVKYWWSYRLDRLGFVERLNDVEFRDRPQPSCGSLNGSTSPQAVELSESEFVHMSGELDFENCSRVLPVVFLSRNDKQEMFAASIVRDFSDRSRKSQIWAAAFFSNDLQPGRNSIRAWVYDPESSAFLSLENSFELQVSATPLADGSP